MLDRILQAISPALTAEVEQIVNETRQALQIQFAERLQLAQAERDDAVVRSIEATREIVRSEVTREVTEVLQTEFDARSNAREEQFKRIESEWSVEKHRLEQQIETLQVLVDGQRQLSEASSQPEMLVRWLRLAEGFARSVAVYTTKGDGLALWQSRGGASFPEIISAQITDPESYFRPIVIREKTVAALSALPPYQVVPLDFLASSMERAIVVFGMKLRAPLAKPAVAEPARIP
jgi:hypothetical protein